MKVETGKSSDQLLSETLALLSGLNSKPNGMEEEEEMSKKK
jgi:hypothetical protein